MRISITPKPCFKVALLIERMYSVARKENSTLKKTTHFIIDQRMYFQFLTAIIKAVLPANKPESMTDSPYEGKKKGKNIITKMPNPNPLTRWIKLAIMVKRKTNNNVMIYYSVDSRIIISASKIISLFGTFGFSNFSIISSTDVLAISFTGCSTAVMDG